MKNLKTEQILSIVISSAKAYAEKLLNKNFLVVYQDRSEIKILLQEKDLKSKCGCGD